MADTWLYYQLFSGSSGREDWLLTEAVAPAVDWCRPGARRWFFLRYFDERGPHVRFRVLAPLADTIAVQRRFEPHIRDVLTRATLLPSDPLARLVKVPPYLAPTGRHIGFNHAVYEPEVHKYGGLVGVAKAEAGFQASSEAVLALLGAGVGSPAERAGLCVHLMHKTVEASLPGHAAAGFWSAYVDHWSGGATTRGAQVRARLHRALGSHVELLADQAAASADRPEVAAAADVLTDGVSRSLQGGPVPPEVQLMHHVHLTNNRLGVLPVEEALFAAVAATLAGLAPAAVVG